eukprot:CAMPEP_0195135966 /NCGR_PEP_ID=MMETSP0448-20130528/153395_1 /TAXON_ID=66468 /ORGANISM="Heterocapsa triquestra, Strain CCMP 448" /LENGTH=61 /DNA_ID=CAMNT_0040174131 /DNA_START=76 /DNA_END=257 /DNA_ORIENTATION=-
MRCQRWQLSYAEPAGGSASREGHKEPVTNRAPGHAHRACGSLYGPGFAGTKKGSVEYGEEL